MTRTTRRNKSARWAPEGFVRQQREALGKTTPRVQAEPRPTQAVQASLTLPAPKLLVPASTGSVANVIQAGKYRLTAAAELGEQIARQLEQWKPRRNVDRLDLIVERVGVVLCWGGSVPPVLASLWHAAQDPQLDGIVLVTARTKPTRTQLPNEVGGKPLRIVHLEGEVSHGQ